MIRDGLTVTWADGRAQRWEERAVPSGGRAYWGVSHELLIRDFYARLDDSEPFWISPAEALKSLEILKRAYDDLRGLTRHQRRARPFDEFYEDGDGGPYTAGSLSCDLSHSALLGNKRQLQDAAVGTSAH